MSISRNSVYFVYDEYLQESRMREIRTSGSMRGSGRRALLRKRPLSLSTLPVSGYAGPCQPCK
jgi:hypothetical protein